MPSAYGSPLLSLSSAELAALTRLSPTARWNTGDTHRVGSTRHQASGLDFTLPAAPDTFNNLLGQLPGFLEQDAAGIRNLTSQAECTRRVASHFHNANSMPGGYYLDAPTLKRLSSLNLTLDFDLYAVGKSGVNNQPIRPGKYR